MRKRVAHLNGLESSRLVQANRLMSEHGFRAF